jgi:predicted metal-dependent phosphoesterase TrpH
MALTDHDTLAGLSDAAAAAQRAGIALINGVEVSVTWGATTLHVLGLRIDPAAPQLCTGLSILRAGRLRRAEAIGKRLEGEGIAGALQGALGYATSSPEMLGRVHFARFLIARGVVKDMKTAFRRFLGEGKAGFVRHRWTTLAEAIEWIRAAGGVALLAHPARYGLRPERLRALFAEFKVLGGTAVEVVSASHTPEDVARIAALAGAVGLHASAGSDFHSPEESWLDLGQGASLPPNCDPVWRDWPECRELVLH